MKAKNYITQEYIKMLKDKKTQTGLYYATPKVVVKGDKYRKALNSNEKLIYQELWDLSMKAAHRGQVDEKGRIYIKVSYSFIASAIGIDVSTVDRAINKRKTLIRLGLIAFKKKGDHTEHEYYVMAPVYEDSDENLLSFDQASWNMRADAKKFANRKNSTGSTQRQTENEQLDQDHKDDLPKDNADHKILHPKENPDYDTYEGKPEDIEQPIETPTEQSPEYTALMKQIISMGIKYHKAGLASKLTIIVEAHFGVGGKITRATEADLSKMQLAYSELESTALSLGVI